MWPMLHSLRKLISQRIWKRLNLRWMLASGIEIQLSCRSDWDIYNEIFVDLDYDEPILATLQSAHAQHRNARILDLGANVGFFGLRWLHLQNLAGQALHTSAVFVEGGKDVFEILQARLESQAGAAMQVRCIHGLAGKSEGTAMLHRSAAHFGNSVHHSTSSGAADVVPYVNLNQICQDWERISLIKCDIEGSEETWLASYPELLARTDRLVIELHKTQVDVAHCDRLITASGLVHKRVIKDRPEFSVIHYWRPFENS
jgi:FkbM family methyltransferase